MVDTRAGWLDGAAIPNPDRFIPRSRDNELSIRAEVGRINCFPMLQRAEKNARFCIPNSRNMVRRNGDEPGRYPG